MPKTEIINLIEAKLKEFEREALRKGIDITSTDFKNALLKLKEAELKAHGISMTEYNSIKSVKKEEKAIADKGEKGDSIKGETGKDGKDGLEGKDGKDGKQGKDGKSGRDGRDGKTGEQGTMGVGIQGLKGIKGDTPDLTKSLKELKKYIDKQVGSQLIGTFKGRVSDKGGRFFNWGMPDKGSYGVAIADSRYYKKELAVPYTGAISDVDLGTYNLTTTGTIQATTFTDGTLSINSGSITGGVSATFDDGDFRVTLLDSGIAFQGTDYFSGVVVDILNGSEAMNVAFGSMIINHDGSIFNDTQIETGILLTDEINSIDNTSVFNLSNAGTGSITLESGLNFDVDGDFTAGTIVSDGLVAGSTVRTGMIDSISPNNLAIDVDSRLLYANDGSDVILDFATVDLAQFGDSDITTTGEVTANVFDIPTTTDATTGVINQNNLPFIHTFGTNNTFIGGAGNFTLTDQNRNTGIGFEALKRLTNTGGNNVAIGYQALDSVTTASQNFGLGTGAGNGLTTGGSNTAIGTFSMIRLTTGINNIGIGRNVGIFLSASSSYNVFLGNYIMGSSANSPTDNIDYNTIVGYRAAYIFTGTPIHNTILGSQAAYAALGGSDNIFIGYKAAYDETGSDTLMIDNRDRTSEALGRTGAIIYGIMDATPSNQALTFNATVEITNDTYWTGAGSGLPYGYCYGDHINWTQASAAQNTWYPVGDGTDTDMISGALNLCTHDAGLITVTKAGIYYISFDTSYEINAANVHVEFGIEVNGADPAADSPHVHTTSKFPNQEQQSSAVGIISLTAGQTIQVSIRHIDVATPNFKIDNVHLTCTQIGGI